MCCAVNLIWSGYGSPFGSEHTDIDEQNLKRLPQEVSSMQAVSERNIKRPSVMTWLP